MADELKSYLDRVNYNDTFAGQVEEAVRRSLSDSGSALLDGESNANIGDYTRLVIGMMLGVAALPDFKASGRVEDLSATMNENSGLEEAA